MVFQVEGQQRIIAALGYEVIRYVYFVKGIDALKEIFLESLVTPEDLITIAKQPHITAGSTDIVIYEDLILAMYMEMLNDENSRLFAATYNAAKMAIRGTSTEKEYKAFVRRIHKGEQCTFGVDATNSGISLVYYMLWYENEIPQHLTKDVSKQSLAIEKGKLSLAKDSMSIDATLKFDDGTFIPSSNRYTDFETAVFDKLIEYLSVRYNNNNISRENVVIYIAKQIHYGMHCDNTRNYVFFDTIGILEKSTLNAIAFLGQQNYNLSIDLLLNVMGDVKRYDMAGLDYRPDVNTIIQLALKFRIYSYAEEHKVKAITRQSLRKEILPLITENIEGFYEDIINLYYIDCFYKVYEKHRDSFYFNFSWFYDIQKRDVMEPKEAEQPIQQAKENNAYTALNERYQREKLRIYQIGKQHTHELQIKEKEIQEAATQNNKLLQELQLQQEYISLLESKEEDVFNAPVDMTALYGTRWLFVGKVQENYPELKKAFPNSVFMENDTASIKSLKVDRVVFLIRHMSHSMFYKVMQENTLSDVPKVYCNTRNYGNIYNDMAKSLE